MEFGGESPLTIRAWYSGFRYCPDPLGIVTAKQLDKLEFGELFCSKIIHQIYEATTAKRKSIPRIIEATEMITPSRTAPS